MPYVSPLRQDLLNYLITNPDKIHTLSKLVTYFKAGKAQVQQMMYRFTQNEELHKRITVVIRGNAWIYNSDPNNPVAVVVNPFHEKKDTPKDLMGELRKSLETAREAREAQEDEQELKDKKEWKDYMHRAGFEVKSFQGELSAQPLSLVAESESEPNQEYPESNCFWRVGETQNGAPVLQGPDRALWTAVRL
jgi:hypothetical protein